MILKKIKKNDEYKIAGICLANDISLWDDKKETELIRLVLTSTRTRSKLQGCIHTMILRKGKGKR